jgi:hypothetical protein
MMGVTTHGVVYKPIRSAKLSRHDRIRTLVSQL